MRHIPFPPSDASQREVITRVAPWWESIDGTVGDGPRIPILDRPLPASAVDSGAGAALARRQVSHAGGRREARS